MFEVLTQADLQNLIKENQILVHTCLMVLVPIAILFSVFAFVEHLKEKEMDKYRHLDWKERDWHTL